MAEAKDFRRIALGFDGAIESAHMGHPDFRANGRVFATLHHDMLRGMVKLTPEQQAQFIRDEPASFTPETGAWGRAGCTAVTLAAIDEDRLGEALTLAWKNSGNVKTEKRATSNEKRKTSTTKKRKR